MSLPLHIVEVCALALYKRGTIPWKENRMAKVDWLYHRPG